MPRRRQNATSILITEYDRTIKAGWRKTCVGTGDLEVSFTDTIEEIDDVVLSEMSQRSGRGAWDEENPCPITLETICRHIFLSKGDWEWEWD